VQRARDGEGPERVYQWWLRLDPPALAWKSRADHHVMDERGHLIASEGRDTCLLFPHRSAWGAAELLGEVVLGSLPGAEQPSTAGVPVPDWSVEQVKLDGRDLLRCRREGAEVTTGWR